MMKRRVTFFLIVCFWTSAACGQAAATGAVQYVSASGKDINNGLSWKTAKATVQTALAAACTGTRAGRVEIATGYSAVIASTVSIPNNCTLDGHGALLKASARLNSPLVAIRTSHVTLENIVLEGNAALQTKTNQPAGPTSALAILGGSYVTADKVTAEDSFQDCIDVSDNSSQVTLEHLKAVKCGGDRGSGNGLYMRATTDATVDDLTVIGTKGQNCVFVLQSNQITLTNLNLSGCQDEGAEIDSSSYVTVSSVDIRHRRLVNGNGVAFLIRGYGGPTSHISATGVTCDSTFAFCVDVAQYARTDSSIRDVSLSNITAVGTGVGSKAFGAGAVRFSGSGTATISNVKISRLVARGTLNGVFCTGGGRGITGIRVSDSWIDAKYQALHSSGRGCSAFAGSGNTVVHGAVSGQMRFAH